MIIYTFQIEERPGRPIIIWVYYNSMKKRCAGDLHLFLSSLSHISRRGNTSRHRLNVITTPTTISSPATARGRPDRRSRVSISGDLREYPPLPCAPKRREKKVHIWFQIRCPDSHGRALVVHMIFGGGSSMALRHGLNCVTQAKPKGGNGLARRPICRSATTTQVEQILGRCVHMVRVS